MLATPPLRWTGMILLLGVIIFSAATIVAEPFEQETPLTLYQAIAQNGATYRAVNLLGGFGFIVLAAAFVLLGRQIPQTHRRLTVTGLTLLALATLLWLVEVIGRITITSATANRLGGSTEVPMAFPANLGIGLEPLFVAFLVTTLAGIALLFWQMEQAGLLSRRLSLLGAGVIVVSGSIAALTYPWVGGVERALFYPFVLVLLPSAIYLLVRRNRI